MARARVQVEEEEVKEGGQPRVQRGILFDSYKSDFNVSHLIPDQETMQRCEREMKQVSDA